MNAVKLRSLTASFVLCFAGLPSGLCQENQEIPLTPIEARKQVGHVVVVQMKPAEIKDRLEVRGEIYIDSEKNFRDEKNFAIVITEKGANQFKKIGIKDPAKYLEAKELRAKGMVKEVQGIPRIEVNDPAQISIIKQKESAQDDDERTQ